jgi:hypothetical protein
MDNFKIRLVNEQVELVTKLEKLKTFLVTDTFKELEMEQAELLILQASIMAAYTQVLTMRIRKL